MSIQPLWGVLFSVFLFPLFYSGKLKTYTDQIKYQAFFFKPSVTFCVIVRFLMFWLISDLQSHSCCKLLTWKFLNSQSVQWKNTNKQKSSVHCVHSFWTICNLALTLRHRSKLLVIIHNNVTGPPGCSVGCYSNCRVQLPPFSGTHFIVFTSPAFSYYSPTISYPNSLFFSSLMCFI